MTNYYDATCTSSTVIVVTATFPDGMVRVERLDWRDAATRIYELRIDGAQVTYTLSAPGDMQAGIASSPGRAGA
jgi:hypothetical protein